MTDVGDGHFDERVASSYDDDENPMFDPAVVEPTVDFLASLANGGRALDELLLPLLAEVGQLRG